MRHTCPAGEARIVEPFEGAVLHHRHGRTTRDGLVVPVRVDWPAAQGRRLWIGRTPAACEGALFRGEALLREETEEIVARADGPEGPAVARTRVVCDRHSRARYRFAIDDNILFLEALTRDRPESIFDGFYLCGLRELYRRYGTRFVLNLFFAASEGPFNLSHVPDDYRGEFADNADWLSLAFHARAEFPPRLYQEAPPEELAADYDRVAQEILRFAGEAAYSPTTLTHWGMVRPDAWPVLAKRGSRILSGYFVPARGDTHTTDGADLETAAAAGAYDINYGMDAARSARLSRGDLLKDFDSGLLFSKVDIVCNNTPADRVASVLGPLVEDPATAEVMDLTTHEQYFWPDYPNYRPDHFARCEAAIRFCAERGHTPVFLHRGLAGAEP